MWWPSFLLGSSCKLDVICQSLKALSPSADCSVSLMSFLIHSVISTKTIFTLIFLADVIQNWRYMDVSAYFWTSLCFDDSTDGAIVNLRLTLKQRFLKCAFVNANASFAFNVKKQARFGQPYCRLLPVPVSEQEGVGVLSVGTWKADQCFGITVFSIWSNFSWLKH